MESFFRTITETQTTSLEAAASFTDSCLIVVERLAQLNVEVTRTAFEKSSEMALLCLESGLSRTHAPGWTTSLQSGLDQFSEYWHSVRAMTQEAAKQD